MYLVSNKEYSYNGAYRLCELHLHHRFASSSCCKHLWCRQTCAEYSIPKSLREGFMLVVLCLSYRDELLWQLRWRFG